MSTEDEIQKKGVRPQKVSDQDVRDARERVARGEATLGEEAKRLGVRRQTLVERAHGLPSLPKGRQQAMPIDEVERRIAEGESYSDIAGGERTRQAVYEQVKRARDKKNS
jgi:hypothetical protein